MAMKQNLLGCVLTGCALLMLNPLVSAQPHYPSKPIRLIVPYASGGSPDIIARLVAHNFSESWGQQVVIDNRPGGNTVIGTELLLKSPADGYTILLVATAHVTTPLLLTTPYDPLKDFTPIATLTVSQLALLVNHAVPANNLIDLIALAKATPGKLNYGSAGNGGSTNLAGELFNIVAGVDIQHIPYKGPAQVLTDLIGGQVQLFFSSPASYLPHRQSGKLRALAISGEQRSAALPDVPTFTEAGLTGIDIKFWFGLMAPAQTPNDIVQKLSTQVTELLNLPSVKEQLVKQGLDPFLNSSSQFSELLVTETAKWTKVIRARNIKMDN